MSTKDEGLEERIHQAREKLSCLEHVRDVLSSDLLDKIKMEHNYIQALKLWSQGWKLREIAEHLETQEYHVKNWVYLEAEPLGNMNIPDFSKTTDIAAMLACAHSDATLTLQRMVLEIYDIAALIKIQEHGINVMSEKNEIQPDRYHPGLWRWEVDSRFLCDILLKTKEDPDLTRRFLEDREALKTYLRVYYTLDGGPALSLSDMRADIWVYGTKQRMEFIRDLLDKLEIRTRGPYIETYPGEVGIKETGEEVVTQDYVYMLRVASSDVENFMEKVGFEGYKPEKYEDAVYLFQKARDMIEGAEISKEEALKWIRDTWGTYYVKVSHLGYVPRPLEEARDTLKGERDGEIKGRLVPNNKLDGVDTDELWEARKEMALEKVEEYLEEARSLRDTLRY